MPNVTSLHYFWVHYFLSLLVLIEIVRSLFLIFICLVLVSVMKSQVLRCLVLTATLALALRVQALTLVAKSTPWP